MYWQRLAQSVISKAFEDAIAPFLPVKDRKWKDDAQRFLGRPSKDLTFWCGLADFDPAEVNAAYKRLVPK